MWFLSQIKQILQLNVQLAENDKATSSQTLLFSPDKPFLFEVENPLHASAAAAWHPDITSVIKIEPFFVLSSIKLCLVEWISLTRCSPRLLCASQWQCLAFKSSLEIGSLTVWNQTSTVNWKLFIHFFKSSFNMFWSQKHDILSSSSSHNTHSQAEAHQL